MKFILKIFMVIGVINYSNSQEVKHYMEYNDSLYFTIKSGSCLSPDGVSKEIDMEPLNYEYLLDNDYCVYSYPTTSTITICYTFTANSESIDVNAAYSYLCDYTYFSNSKLFDNNCIEIETGLSFSNLTIGQNYTWCLDIRVWGGFFCNGFNTFCPYFLNNKPLPVELSYFKGLYSDGYNIIEWVTLSESNNHYFELEKSIDGIHWEYLHTEYGAGDSNYEIIYGYVDRFLLDTINYYKLTQVDFDGSVEVLDVISIDNRNLGGKIVKQINIFGQEVNSSYNGLVIQIFNDGSIRKVYINK